MMSFELSNEKFCVGIRESVTKINSAGNKISSLFPGYWLYFSCLGHVQRFDPIILVMKTLNFSVLGREAPSATSKFSFKANVRMDDPFSASRCIADPDETELFCQLESWKPERNELP